MAIKQLRLLSVDLLSSAELEAIVSALRYINITTKNNKFVVFGDSKSALQAPVVQVGSPHSSDYYEIFSFLTYCT